MGIRLVVAAPQPGYASRLALYLKERDPLAEIAAFTQADALELHLRSGRGADLLIVQQTLLPAVVRASSGGAKVVVLTESGDSEMHEGLPAIAQYQSLPRLAAEIRRLVGAGASKPSEGGGAVDRLFGRRRRGQDDAGATYRAPGFGARLQRHVFESGGALRRRAAAGRRGTGRGGDERVVLAFV
ncbi:hypothetical protein [Cohnella rhizosphaerae]|uniref:Uncharacterized protein n=1 Tax=Cohnella rhizosphaerae TaxID=1457232 RepID=A0A9X4QRK5_9BACL|nr:hypothetical protein [Cohnella rhizosphaerae]MDG0808348.1 hypothetical protein [Cohnella rhizosphaerae]